MEVMQGSPHNSWSTGGPLYRALPVPAGGLLRAHLGVHVDRIHGHRGFNGYLINITSSLLPLIVLSGDNPVKSIDGKKDEKSEFLIIALSTVSKSRIKTWLNYKYHSRFIGNIPLHRLDPITSFDKWPFWIRAYYNTVPSNKTRHER